MKQFSLAIMLLLTPAVCLAQAAKKIPIAVDHYGDDQVGKAIALALKEAISGSRSFKLVDQEALPKTPRIVIDMISVDTTLGSTTDFVSSISFSILYKSSALPVRGALIHSRIISCGQDWTDSCAKDALVSIERAVQYFRNEWPDLWKTL